LRYWLTTRTSIRASTLRSYTDHVERVLVPRLGRIRLGELTARQVRAMFVELAATVNRSGRALAPSTLHRVRATLRSAMNGAIREGLIRDNPARYVELPAPSSAGAGVDRQGSGVGTERVASCRRGLDPDPGRRLSDLRRLGSAVRDVVADRAARVAAR
jgi:hypothetical protein